ncbi:hypothetical protein BJF81_11280 [Ornithinimicrobium sp. CNJ-824]|nr:hypothetical protein BJF81_11280 [Ornithinimicrobium sp. CNJ-824]
MPAPVPPGAPPAADGPDPWQRLTPEELTRLHRPGVVPLRPLGLGDIFGGSLQTMRRNPRATVGMALLVLAALLVPSLLLSLGVAGTSLLAPTDREAVLLLVTLVFSALASTTLTGLIVHTVGEAVLGDRAGLGEAWEAVRGRIPALLGALVLMTVLLLLAGVAVVGVVVLATWAATGAGDLPAVLVAVGGGLAGAVLLVWAGSRLSLAPAPVVLERAGPWRGVRRAWALTSGRSRGGSRGSPCSPAWSPRRSRPPCRCRSPWSCCWPATASSARRAAPPPWPSCSTTRCSWRSTPSSSRSPPG